MGVALTEYFAENLLREMVMSQTTTFSLGEGFLSTANLVIILDKFQMGVISQSTRSIIWVDSIDQVSQLNRSIESSQYFEGLGMLITNPFWNIDKIFN